MLVTDPCEGKLPARAKGRIAVYRSPGDRRARNQAAASWGYGERVVPIFIGRGAPLLDIARYDRLTALVRDALGLVARARGMGGIAKKAGLNRESLYKALGETGNPEFGTVMRIVRALGLTLSAHPAASGQTSKRRRVA